MNLLRLIAVILIFNNILGYAQEANSEYDNLITEVKEKIDKEITVLILENDTIKILESDLSRYIESYPVLSFKNNEVISPELAYDMLPNYIDFLGEAGKDRFFILYSYFLKQKNGIEKYKKKREELVSVLSSINQIHGGVYGGVHWGHRSYRIYGIAEYSIYKSIKNIFYNKRYDFLPQKKLFIKSIEQFIMDEISVYEVPLLPEEKERKISELVKLLDEVDNLITDYFLLLSAQKFFYAN